MAWRLAKSIVTLRDEVNARWPDRNKASDGTIGDAAHATRNSDHNPFVTVNGIGVVRAFDITHDPSGGPSGDLLARHFAQMAKGGDKRVRYAIWERRIFNPSISMSWRPYHGSNPHDKHVHLSVSLSRSHFDRTSGWGISGVAGNDEEDDMFCKLGNQGEKVEYLQLRLRGLGAYDGEIDSDYGPKTADALFDVRKSVGSGTKNGNNFNAWAAFQLDRAERGAAS